MTLDYFYGQAGELFSFFRIPKALFQEQRFQDLSTDAKTLYGILLDRMSLSVKNEWFDKKGRVFIIFTIEDVKRTLRCADNKATRLLRELEGFGLIERKRRGQGGYEIISGHRRQHAAQLAGLETLPVIVRNMDDAAVLLMVDSNLQRESILTSEKQSRSCAIASTGRRSLNAGCRS